MTHEELSYFETTLTDWEKQILKNLQGTYNELSGLREDCLLDEGDQSSANMEYIISEAIGTQQNKELEEIRHALKKFSLKTYGICEMCDEEIDIERLKVKPHAKYCIICRGIVEENMKRGRS